MMNNFHSTTSGDSGWGEARLRIEAYLVGMGITSETERERVIQNILKQTAIEYAGNPEGNPVALAMNQLLKTLDQWAGKFSFPDEQSKVRGSVLLYAVDGPKMWPAALFTGEMPDTFRQAISDCQVAATPDLSVSRMVPQPFDNALLDIKLPNAVGKLTKDISPSFLAKAAAVVASGLALLFGNRLR